MTTSGKFLGTACMFGTHDKLNEDGLRYEHRGSKSVVDRKVHCLVHPRDIEPKCVVSELLTHPYAAIYCPRFYQQAENFLGVCSSSPFPQLGLDELPVLPSTVKRRLQLAIYLTGTWRFDEPRSPSYYRRCPQDRAQSEAPRYSNETPGQMRLDKHADHEGSWNAGVCSRLNGKLWNGRT